MKKRGYVLASSYRQGILYALSDGPKMVSTLSDDLGIAIQNASRTLRDLEKRGIVRCLAPERRKGRDYELTAEGRRLLRNIPSASATVVPLRKREANIAKLFDGVRVPYVRNLALKGGNFSMQPDFVILHESAPRVAVEVKTIKPGALPAAIEGMRASALLAEDLKKSTTGLKVIIVVGGMRRNDPRASEVLKFEKTGHFDRVFFDGEEAELASFVEREAGSVPKA